MGTRQPKKKVITALPSVARAALAAWVPRAEPEAEEGRRPAPTTGRPVGRAPRSESPSYRRAVAERREGSRRWRSRVFKAHGSARQTKTHSRPSMSGSEDTTRGNTRAFPWHMAGTWRAHGGTETKQRFTDPNRSCAARWRGSKVPRRRASPEHPTEQGAADYHHATGRGASFRSG